ncbi:LAMI_0B05600g1_1 [Lachancea mirantina]|uniref:LAMI_0B05600g1_1 n=1 Tax=Lachancea mirantina TaxID=1230905 RepID=A0A1G4IW47_9SACH|nr:LAMI_0B05600g1_1 [Lachancea mirantina]
MGEKSPRKTTTATGKRPSHVQKLKTRTVGGKSAPILSRSGSRAQRPRRFSLIYSSDSSLSAVSDLENSRKVSFKNPSLGKKAKRGVNNELGKRSRLIPEEAVGSESSDVFSSDSDGVADGKDGGDDDDDDGSDGYSSSSSSDDDVDFVKLSAERKKKAMQAMSALKRGKMPKKGEVIANAKEKRSQPSSGDDDADADALSFSFKNDDGIKFSGNTREEDSDSEDLGEEVNDGSSQATKSIGAKKSYPLDQLNVPQISESEDSDYEIDRDLYLKSIQSDHGDTTGLENGFDTGDDDRPMLDEEEQNIVMELENDDSLSFNGSIHEEGEDPVENGNASDHTGEEVMQSTVRRVDDKAEDDEDEIMSDFDAPFYEDPKFANLYYCAGSDQPLSLSTSLPLILNDEKRKKFDKKQNKRREWEELRRRRKQLRELARNKQKSKSTPDPDADDYLFGVFFHSDSEHEKKTALESPLRRLSSAAVSDDEYSSEDDYEDILLDIAHMPTDDESLNGIEDSLDFDGEDDDDDDVSVSNVFIDIDDLDPDAFYFQYETSEDSIDEDEHTKDYKLSKTETQGPNNKENQETIAYVDNESTDEDETLPPPNTRNRKIGSKAKEVVSANVVGLKPPKLGTWHTDDKPFSIIDGLSTKSLYPLIDEQRLFEQQQAQLQQQLSAGELSGTGEKEELTLNELLNMSELEDEEGNGVACGNAQAISGWYEKPKVPLSAFRNKGIDAMQEEEFMLPNLSARKFPIGYVGSERTRRKIDRMKELQKRNEEKRKVKRKKKLFKLKRERARLDKERSLLSDGVDDVSQDQVSKRDDEQHHHILPAEVGEGITELDSHDGIVLPRKGSIKGLDLNDINNILASGDTDWLPQDSSVEFLAHGDADILASLAAPVSVGSGGDGGGTKQLTGGAVWRRRQSIFEAAAENLRFTKGGLFSETALADLEHIIGSSSGPALEINEMLQ